MSHKRNRQLVDAVASGCDDDADKASTLDDARARGPSTAFNLDKRVYAGGAGSGSRTLLLDDAEPSVAAAGAKHETKSQASAALSVQAATCRSVRIRKPSAAAAAAAAAPNSVSFECSS
jgi:hypothetical protein